MVHSFLGGSSCIFTVGGGESITIGSSCDLPRRKGLASRSSFTSEISMGSSSPSSSVTMCSLPGVEAGTDIITGEFGGSSPG